MATQKEIYNEKLAQVLVKNLKSRHFDAYYCATKEEALDKALSLIPQGATVGWGGATSAQQIGLLDAIKNGHYNAYDRDKAKDLQERAAIATKCLGADVFITGANAISLDGEMVNMDGIGNRVAAIIYGPKTVLVVAGMNKVCKDLAAAVDRVRNIAAPTNQQRFLGNTPCTATACCADCKSMDCICCQMVISRLCRPAGRIKFVLVGENLGF